MRASDFYTVPKSEAGVRVPLAGPDGGDTGEWLLVVGPSSRAYAQAAARLNRQLVQLQAIEDETEREARSEALWAEHAAGLVIGWSLEDEFTPEAVLALMRNAPAVRNAIPDIAGDPRRFFGPASPSSAPGPTRNGGSGEATGISPSSDSASDSLSYPPSSATSSATSASSDPAS
jgi:hypothetical protein